MNLGRLRQGLSLLIALAFVAWAVNVLVAKSNELPTVSFGLGACLLIIVATLAVIALNGAIGEQASRLVGSPLPARTWLSIGFVSILLNYFLPFKAGSLFRLAAYVRLARQDMLHLVASFTMSALLIQVMFAAFLMVALLASHDASVQAVATLGVAVSAVAAVVLLTRSRLSAWPRLKRLKNGIDAWINGGSGVLAMLALLAFLLLVLTIVRYGAVGWMIGLHPGLAALTLIACVSSLSALVGVTFGGLGVREAAIIVAAHLSGISDGDALAFALLDRLAVSVIVLPAGLACLAYLKRQSPKPLQ